MSAFPCVTVCFTETRTAYIYVILVSNVRDDSLHCLTGEMFVLPVTSVDYEVELFKLLIKMRAK